LRKAPQKRGFFLHKIYEVGSYKGDGRKKKDDGMTNIINVSHAVNVECCASVDR